MEPQDTEHPVTKRHGYPFFSTDLKLRDKNTAEDNNITPVLKGLSKGILGNI